MRIKHFGKGARLTIVSRRTGAPALSIERLASGQLRVGGAGSDGLRVQMDGSALDVRGMVRDAEGPAVQLRAKDQEIYADCVMEIALPGKQPEKFMMATQTTFDRMMEATKERRAAADSDPAP